MPAPQFHETMYGKRFFESQLPKLTKAIDRLAAAMEEANTKPKHTDYTLVFKYVKGKMVYFSGVNSTGAHQFTEDEATAVKFYDLDEAMKFHTQEGYGLVTKVNPVHRSSASAKAETPVIDNTEAVIAAVRKALSFYSSENVDVVLNGMTSMLDVIFHSDTNSFPIQHSVTTMDTVDRDTLIAALNAIGVGYCF